MNKKFVYTFTKEEVAAALWNQYAKSHSDEEFKGVLKIDPEDTVSMEFTAEVGLKPEITDQVQ